MDYFLTEEQQMIQELAGRIAREKIRPIRSRLDEQEEFPWEIMKVLAQSDLFGLYIPEAYGGLGGGIFENCLAVEQLAEACIGVATSFAASGLGAYPILLYGSETQKTDLPPRDSLRQAPGRLRPHRTRAGKRCLSGIRNHCGSRRRSLYPERHQAVDHQRRRVRDLLGPGNHRPVRGPTRGEFLHRGERRPRIFLRQEGKEARNPRLRNPRTSLPGLPHPEEPP